MKMHFNKFLIKKIKSNMMRATISLNKEIKNEEVISASKI